MEHRAETQAIEIRVDEIAQLFDTLDPFPFRERDLDADAEEYIVGWARELPAHGPITIVVHVPAEETSRDAAEGLEAALQRFFAYRADVTGRDLKEMLRIGRRSLLIGAAVLGLCLVLGQGITGRLGESHLARFVEESLYIVGWVANWRPIEVFLYDWWPIARRRRLYLRLAGAHVVLRSGDADREIAAARAPDRREPEP